MKLREHLAATMRLHSLNNVQTAKAIGCGETTVRRVLSGERDETNLERPTLAKIVAWLDGNQVTEPPPVEPIVDEPSLPVARHTGMLNERQHEGRPVYTLADVAEGLGVTVAAVYNILDRRADEFCQGRDLIHALLNGSPVRLLTRRGAMRVAMHSHGPNALALQNHLLDLDEAVATGQLQPAPVPMSEVDRLAATTNQLANVLGAGVIEAKQAAAEARQIAEEAKALASAKDVDAEKVTRDAANVVLMDQARAAKLRPVLESLCQEYGRLRETNGYGQKVNETIDLNRTLKRTYGKRDLLTTQQLERAIGFVQSLIADLPDPDQPMGI